LGDLNNVTNKTNKQPAFMDRDDYCSIFSTFTVSNTQQTAAASMGEGVAVLTDEKTSYFLVDFLVVARAAEVATLAAVSCEISLIHPHLNVCLQSLCTDTNEVAGCSKPLAKNSSSQKTKRFVQNSILMSSNKCASLLASSNLVSKFLKCTSLISLH
jgi:hypothetical protein